MTITVEAIANEVTRIAEAAGCRVDSLNLKTRSQRGPSTELDLAGVTLTVSWEREQPTGQELDDVWLRVFVDGGGRPGVFLDPLIKDFRQVLQLDLAAIAEDLTMYLLRPAAVS